MKFSRSARRSIILVASAAYFFLVVRLTGLEPRPTTMAEFLGLALIYAAGVGLVSSLLFILERRPSATKEEEFCTEAIRQAQDRRD